MTHASCPAFAAPLGALDAGFLSGTGRRAPSQRAIAAKSFGGITMPDLATRLPCRRSDLVVRPAAGCRPDQKVNSGNSLQPANWRSIIGFHSRDRPPEAPPL